MSNRRLVLAFDDSCCRCPSIARAAAGAAPRDRLEVLPLADPAVRAWLAEAAVEPTRPVLVAGDGPRRRVHTGLAAVVVLVRHLGLPAALRVLRAVAAPAAGGPVADTAADGRAARPSRRAVLRTCLVGAGVVAAASLPRPPAAGATTRTIAAAAAAEIGELRAWPTMVTAARVFGRPAWDTVVRDQEFAGGPRRFTTMVRHEEHGAVFVVAPEAPGSVAIALRPVPAAGRIDVYGADGAPLVSVRVGRRDVVVDSATPPPDLFTTRADAPEGPSRAFFLCFRTCLEARGLGEALLPCWSCLNSPNDPASIPSCMECAALAGNAFGGCVRQCIAVR